MALIKCPECGREISDKAVSCPGCGCPATCVNAALEKNRQNNTNKQIIVCPYCNSKQILDDGYCDSCGMKITLTEEINVYSNNDNQKIPDTPYTICPKCGYYNLTGIYKCKNCKHKYTMEEYKTVLPDVLQKRIETFNIRTCPKCGSERIHAFVDTVQTSRGKTKTKYTANLNPLRPFTLVNKKEKIVSKPQYVSISKMQCDNCGKIFR